MRSYWDLLLQLYDPTAREPTREEEQYSTGGVLPGGPAPDFGVGEPRWGPRDWQSPDITGMFGPTPPPANPLYQLPEDQPLDTTQTEDRRGRPQNPTVLDAFDFFGTNRLPLFGHQATLYNMRRSFMPGIPMWFSPNWNLFGTNAPFNQSAAFAPWYTPGPPPATPLVGSTEGLWPIFTLPPR